MLASYYNKYLKPVPYNLQQITYMAATVQRNISAYIKMYKHNKQKRGVKERNMVLISKKKKRLQIKQRG